MIKMLYTTFSPKLCLPFILVALPTVLCLVDSVKPSSSNTEILGEYCATKGEPCATSHSLCIGHACQCEEGFFETPFKDNCLPKAKRFRDHCTFDEQCTSGLGSLSKCSNGRCFCVNGAVPNQDRSKCEAGEEKILIGQPCVESRHCVGNFEGENATSVCGTSGYCTCLPGFIYNEEMDECLKIVDRIGEQCEEPQQCKLGNLGILSDCVTGTFASGAKVCNCTENAVNGHGQEEDYCRQKFTLLVGPCDVHEQCFALLGYSYCLNGKCRCFPNAQYMRAPDGKFKCVPY